MDSFTLFSIPYLFVSYLAREPCSKIIYVLLSRKKKSVNNSSLVGETFSTTFVLLYLKTFDFLVSDAKNL